MADSRRLRARGKTVAAMLRDYVIYLDDSGTDPAQSVVVVAGYISTAREWKKFSAGWLAVLRRYELPHFHMSEFLSQRGSELFPKGAWRDDRKNALITELVGLVGRSAMLQVGASLPKHDWDAIMTPFVKKHMGSPFMVCLDMCLRAALQWPPIDLGPSERVPTVFDQGTRSAQRQARTLYNREKEIRETIRNDQRLGPFRFEDKRCCPPLQAADMPALLLYQFLRDKGRDKGRVRHISVKLVRRLGTGNVKMRYMDQRILREHVENLKKEGLFEGPTQEPVTTGGNGPMV
jgi:Protein of unknown function (DUF3800)